MNINYKKDGPSKENLGASNHADQVDKKTGGGGNALKMDLVRTEKAPEGI